MATECERQQWARLIERLSTWASAVAESEDRVRVTLTNGEASGREVFIHMSAHEWSESFGTMWHGDPQVLDLNAFERNRG